MSAPPRPDEIRDAIRRKYTDVARSARAKISYPTGRAGAAHLGYDARLVDSAPTALLESFCGVGNPFALGAIASGERVLDIGCGAGFDLYVAARAVGPDGSVHGIDLTPAMVTAARENLASAGVTHGTVEEGNVETLPQGDASFDVIISNGVLNLSVDKPRAFGELHRVLRPGGRLQFADIVLNEALPHDVAGSLEAWSD